MIDAAVDAADCILRARGGSSLACCCLASAFLVFSAHAEVVPNQAGRVKRVSGILRARGGSSNRIATRLYKIVYSPRTRR